MICFGETMIQQSSLSPSIIRESKFKVGSFHQNRNGSYEIVALKNPHATIRYQDGTQKVCNLAALRKIEANILCG
jgi:hypothetical protein